MRVGVPKEIKNHEYRVGLTPPSVAELVAAGHDVVVETGAGLGIDFADAAYIAAGATILPDAAIGVRGRRDDREGQGAAAVARSRCCEPRHLLFTYLHLAADKPQAEGLMESGATCIAYETVTAHARRPAAAQADERSRGAHVGPGRRALSGEGAGRPRRAARRRARRGAGARSRSSAAASSGVNAAQMAVGMRADVTIYDINNDRLAELDMFFASQIKTAYASKAAIAAAVKNAHLVIGAVLVPGAAAPKLVTREMLKTMKRGSGAGRHRDRPGRLLRDQPRRPRMRTRCSRSTA